MQLTRAGNRRALTRRVLPTGDKHSTTCKERKQEDKDSQKHQWVWIEMHCMCYAVFWAQHKAHVRVNRNMFTTQKDHSEDSIRRINGGPSTPKLIIDTYSNSSHIPSGLEQTVMPPEALVLRQTGCLISTLGVSFPSFQSPIFSRLGITAW